MEIAEYVASNGKHYQFYPDRVRVSQSKNEESKIPSVYVGAVCPICGGNERYVRDNRCCACMRVNARKRKQRLRDKINGM
ncbi:TPA: hypothetical protein ACIBRT_003775 [Salmonella enterica subsp. enterica serovar Aberdeen]